MFCYAAPDWSIASLVFFPCLYLEADSMFALAFTDKMAKKQQELKFFMHQDSLPAPSLPEQSFSVANESCSGRKKQQKTVPHPLPLTTIDKLRSPHEIKSQTINQTALTIRNGSKTTPGFDLRRADGNFRLWW